MSELSLSAFIKKLNNIEKGSFEIPDDEEIVKAIDTIISCERTTMLNHTSGRIHIATCENIEELIRSINNNI